MAAAMPSPGATLRVRAERVAGHEEEDETLREKRIRERMVS